MRVLIADDNRVARHLLQRTLARWGYEVVPCAGGAEAWAALQRRDAPKLVVLDWMMPGMNGDEICRRLRELPAGQYAYVVLLTSKDSKEDVVDGLEAGADDYITKPFDPHELRVRLRAGQRILELQAKLVAAQEALAEQASHDALTGLWNRAAIEDILQREQARAARDGKPLAVAVADIDHFKQVNDTYGHAAGDAVLREVAQRFQSAVRTYDSIARHGGEEFLLVLPGCDGPTARAIAERVRVAMVAMPFDTDDGSIDVTVSLGVAVCEAADTCDTGMLIRAADRALYRAKAEGRNCVHLAGPAPRRGQPEPDAILVDAPAVPS